MSSLAAVVACVAMLSGLPVPGIDPVVVHVEQSKIDASFAGRSARNRRYRGLFWPYRRDTNGPAIWLGPRATDITLAHEITHWLQLMAGRPYTDHRLPNFVARKYAVWCRRGVRSGKSLIGTIF